jgi:hypothetical protein
MLCSKSECTNYLRNPRNCGAPPGTHEPVTHGSNLTATSGLPAAQREGPCGPQSSFTPNKRRARARYTNTTRSKPPDIMNSNPRSSTSYQRNATGLNVDANSGLPAAQREGPCGPQSFMPSMRKARTRYTNTTRSKPPGITDSNPRKWW